MNREKKSIVCIDDEPDMISFVELVLRDRYELVGAMGGQEGLEAIQRVKPDLVLLDLMMPDMDGWEVYRQLKGDACLKDIPVIVVTAKGQSVDKIFGLHVAGVEDYLTKPFGPQQLLQSIEKVLSRNV